MTLLGLLALPAMLRARYDVPFATGAICAGGCLGILIPPSIMLIVYGATAGVSVVRLYAGALIPGFLLAGLYIVYVVTRAWLNPKLAPKMTDEEAGQRLDAAGLLDAAHVVLPAGLPDPRRARRDPVRACDAVGSGGARRARRHRPRRRLSAR